MNERIEAAFERVAAIEERRQGHVVESSLTEKESKFEAGIQDILDLLVQAEADAEAQAGGLSGEGGLLQVLVQLLARIRNVRRKLVVLVNEERGKERQPQALPTNWLDIVSLFPASRRGG